MLAAGFWDNQELAQQTTKEISILKRTIEEWNSVHALHEDALTLVELLDEAEDENFRAELESLFPRLERAVDELELASLLNGEYDHGNAILTIHPGAGGTESQDWASMLHRMYVRWAEDQGYDVEVVFKQQGQEGS